MCSSDLRAATKVKPAPKRSMIFLAVTAEEQGLLGSQYYAQFPLYPLEKTLANRLERWRANGCTTVEVKSGYGLNTMREVRLLELMSGAAMRVPVPMIMVMGVRRRTRGASCLPLAMGGQDRGDR